jgi:eukaryotic-like serine/threonine-protein kinase
MSVHPADRDHTGCPSADDLRAFTVGRLAADARERIACHIESCAACLTRLNQLTEERDALLADLRRPVPADLFAESRKAGGRPREVERSPGSAGRLAVPGYEILQELGRGGMGVVYQARQASLNRLVALKVILAGLHAGTEQRARFRIEAEAVARLQHSNIVQIHEVGEHDGQAYLALEFVDGSSLARRLAGSPLPPTAAARLVETLARAMYHAHQRGIVHRDLKPANVLLTADGIPKITDFGLAKRLEGEGVTGSSGAILGTPSYMAPEQARGDSRQVGPAADIYALGAILYELLTGRTPFKAAMALETLQQVLHQEPVPPRRLQPGVPRDLETICLKCLHKEPARRYADAEALAEDLRRFQAGEPIRARPLGLAARGWKWARRRPASAALVGVTVLALVGGVTGALWYAQRERDRANQESALRREADDQREQARAVLGFFENRVLAAARPEGEPGGLGKDATIRAAVDAAEPTIEQAFADQPVVAATIRDTVGTTYWYLGEPLLAIRQFEQAVALRRQALGPDHYETLKSMNNLALAYQDAGRFSDALPLLEKARQEMKAHFGSNDPNTLQAMNNLALAYRAVGRLGDAVPLAEETLEKRRAVSGPDHADTLRAMNNLAWIYKTAGRLADALPLYEECVQGSRAHLGPTHPDTLNHLNNLAQAYRAARRVAEALPLYEEALTGRREKLGPTHPLTLITMDNLALAYQEAGRLADALPLFEEALKGFQAKLPPDHPDTLRCMSYLAGAYLDANQSEKAMPLLHDYLAAGRRQLGPNDPRLAGTLGGLGLELLKHGLHTEAEQVLRECLTIREAKFPDDWGTFDAKSLLGASLLGQGKYAEAEPLLLQGYEGLRAHEPTIPPQDKKSLNKALKRLVHLYDAWGKKAQADEWRKRRDTEPDPAPLPK